MVTHLQQIDLPNLPYSQDDWTFKGADTREYTHIYHDYPAKMIPQIARKLLKLYGVKGGLLFDPYCGTGTSLVEAKLYPMNALGTDVNPLARLIAKAKTQNIHTEKLCKAIIDFQNSVAQIPANYDPDSDLFPKLSGLLESDFWFTPQVKARLSFIKQWIDKIEDEGIRLFFSVAFSETVRESSNTRSHEFKLYRYSAETLAKHDPQVFEIMRNKLLRNERGYHAYHHQLATKSIHSFTKIYDFNSVFGIADDLIPHESVDLVITSPPYGDSRTTVAYGQYSRLSSEWLGYGSAGEIDRNLMGGRVKPIMGCLPSEALRQAIDNIASLDNKRALEVLAFYTDLQHSIEAVAKVVKNGGRVCYVVGNRTVKGQILPTNQAVVDFFEANGFVFEQEFLRAIPNKRMPLKNSPSNLAGHIQKTMTKEYIIVMRKATTAELTAGN